MGNNKLLGCWGVVVGVIAAMVIGWMSFEFLLGVLGSLSTEGPAATLASAMLHHEAGELLVIGLSVLAVYMAVFRPAQAIHFARTTRFLFYTGALLNMLAWMRMPAGNRWSGWMILLAVIGVLGPWFLERVGRSTPHAHELE